MASRTVARLTGTTATVLVTAAMAAIPLAGIANAAPSQDLDCADFPSQEAAQTVFDSAPGDPNRLDRNDNGVACEDDDGDAGERPADEQPAENRPADDRAADDRGSDDQVGTTPVGSVDAGDGSAVAAGPTAPGEDPIIFVLGGFGALAATGAAASVWNTRRSGTSRR